MKNKNKKSGWRKAVRVVLGFYALIYAPLIGLVVLIALAIWLISLGVPIQALLFFAGLVIGLVIYVLL